MPPPPHQGAPKPDSETARLAALHGLDVLDTLAEPAFDDIATLAATICTAPIALVSLIDSDRQWFKACIGLSVRETPRDQAFCAHAVLQPSTLLIVEDTHADARFANNPLVLGEPHIRFYAGAPIVTNDGHALGTVCVIDRTPRSLDPTQRAALEALARQTASLLRLRRLTVQRGEEKRELQRKITDALSDDDHASAPLKQRQRVGSVGQLTSGIAHDFNNLLQTIGTCLQLIERRAQEPEQVRRWTGTGLTAVARGADLIAQLLSFSRQESPEQETLCVNVSVDRMRELLARALGPEVRLSFRLEAGRLLTTANETQLEAALLNLVINARDAMEGRGEIEVSTSAVRIDDDPELASGRYVELRVRDSGPGMPPDVAARAFEPFFTTKAEGKGTGLGLSQVFGVAVKAGGVARIRTEAGAGTTVSLLLRAAEHEAPAASSSGSTDTPCAGNGRCRLLLVDDETTVREALAELLRDANFDVEAVGGGVEALQAIERRAPDAVITDQAMQGLTGALLARVLAETHPRLPVVFMTGYDDVEQVKARVAPDSVVLRKPVLLGDLTQVVQDALRQRAG